MQRASWRASIGRLGVVFQFLLLHREVTAQPGQIDPRFNTGANDQVYAIAVQPDGGILIGGRFSSVGGVPRTHLARLYAETPGANLLHLAQPSLVPGGGVRFRLQTSQPGRFKIERSDDLRHWQEWLITPVIVAEDEILDTGSVPHHRFYRASGPVPSNGRPLDSPGTPGPF